MQGMGRLAVKHDAAVPEPPWRRSCCCVPYESVFGLQSIVLKSSSAIQRAKLAIEVSISIVPDLQYAAINTESIEVVAPYRLTYALGWFFVKYCVTLKAK